MSILPTQTDRKLPPFTHPTATELRQPAPQQLNRAHPLEERLANYATNAQQFKSELLKSSFGQAEPLRRAIEAQIAAPLTPQLNQSHMSLDILENRDAQVTWEDVYPAEPSLDFHAELQKVMHK